MMKVKQFSIVAVIVIGVIIAVVVLYNSSGKNNDSSDGDGYDENNPDIENYAEIKELVEEYTLENNSDAFRESLDYKTLTVETIGEADNDDISAIYWEVKEAERILDDDDYLVIITSTDQKNMLRLVIDTETMAVIGHIPVL